MIFEDWYLSDESDGVQKMVFMTIADFQSLTIFKNPPRLPFPIPTPIQTRGSQSLIYLRLPSFTHPLQSEAPTRGGKANGSHSRTDPAQIHQPRDGVLYVM